MSPARLISPLLVSIIALATPSAAANPTPQDLRATHRYLQLDAGFLQTAVGNLPAGVAAANELRARFNGECSNVLAAAPSGTQLGELGIEELEVMAYTLVKPSFPAVVRFARAVKRLRWSNKQLTALVHALAAEDLAEAKLAIPNLCADLKAWVASGYRTIPADAVRFDKAAGREPEIREPNREAPVGLVEATQNRLSHYQGTADRALARRVANLDSKLKTSLTQDVFAAVQALADGRPPRK